MTEFCKREWGKIIGEASMSNASDVILACGKVYCKHGSESLKILAEYPLPDFGLLVDCVCTSNMLVKSKHTVGGGAGASDYSWEFGGRRFRVNKYKSSCGLCLALRPLSDIIPTLDALEFGRGVRELLDKTRQGLIVVTGPAGSGKSTSLASMIDYLNANYPLNIVSIEDPIEYKHRPKSGLVTQREIGIHVSDFRTAVRSAMRQSPDVIFVGEIRDYETLKACLRAAETGHLVLSTLHTRGVSSTLMRILDMAPGDERAEVSSMLSNAYQMIVYQRLLCIGGGYLTIREILMPHAGARNCIRTGNVAGVDNIIQMSKGLGMQSWKGDIEEKLRLGRLSREIAETLMMGA